MILATLPPWLYQGSGVVVVFESVAVDAETGQPVATNRMSAFVRRLGPGGGGRAGATAGGGSSRDRGGAASGRGSPDPAGARVPPAVSRQIAPFPPGALLLHEARPGSEAPVPPVPLKCACVACTKRG